MIEDAAKASGLSVKRLAANAGISDTRWRHIVRGWQPAPGGSTATVHAPASTLARMAFAVGVSPEDLAATGRTDAADLLSRMSSSGDSALPLPPSAGPRPAAADRGADEIDMIYASTTMSAEQKLRAIRQVLTLRAQVEADAGRREPAPAPAENNGGATAPS